LEVCHVIAKRPLIDVVREHFRSFGFPLVVDSTLIPPDDDLSTLFICSGMQPLKHRFKEPDGSKHGSLQSCLRTNDLDLVGDGTHLTYFQMLGNFCFGGSEFNYEESVELWSSLMRELKVPITHVTVHPSQTGHRKLWEKRGWEVRPDESCQWTDGEIGGYCCEMYADGLEVGNLVNTLGRSVDVGFGWERLHQVIEGKKFVHETSIFQQDLHPVVADHLRALEALSGEGIRPGYKGRDSVYRRLLQRIAKFPDDLPKLPPGLVAWVKIERDLQERRLEQGRRLWPRHKNKPSEWWKNTHGLSSEDLRQIAEESKE